MTAREIVSGQYPDYEREYRGSIVDILKLEANDGAYGRPEDAYGSNLEYRGTTGLWYGDLGAITQDVADAIKADPVASANLAPGAKATLPSGPVTWRGAGGWKADTASGLPVFFSLGDSISNDGGYRWNASTYPDPNIYRYSWQWYAQAASDSKMRFGGAFGQAGYTVEQIVATWLPSLLSKANRGDFCFVLMGQNNLGSATPSTLDVYTSAIQQIEAAGLVPVLCTLTPGAATAWFHKFNTHIRNLAKEAGRYLCDFAASVTNPSTGSWVSALTRDAGTHPNALGAWTMGQTAAAVISAIAPVKSYSAWLPVSEAGYSQSRAGGGTILSQLFLTDNGATPPAPAGWSFPAAGVAGTVAFNTVAGIPGRVMRLTRVGANDPVLRCAFSTDGIQIGDKFVFTMRVTSNIAATSTRWAFALIDASGNAFYDRGRNNFHYIEVDQTDDVFVGEFTADRASANGFLDIAINNGAGGYVDISQVQVLNLTALGIV